MLFNKAPYAIIARKSRGIHALSDIEGKNLGVAEGDLSIRLWPAVAQQNGIKHREREAEQHQRRGARADAVGGPDRCRHRILLSVGDQSAGIAACRPTIWRCCDSPTMAARPTASPLIVNPALAAAKPEAVKGFVRAVIGGLHLTIKDPAARRGRSRQPHGRRLAATSNSNACAAILRDNILTSEVKRNGIGGIDPARFERSIDQIAEDFKFQKRPQAARHFRRPVPAAAQRPPDQLSKTSISVRRCISRGDP